MPTTSNFGWTTPADTDLVKDGALAIRTLGNGIDTSFLDLKGGTTGQNLRKASNTDLDFTFAGDATNTVVDAEGDLLVGDAADTLQRLAIGSNGNVLTVDTTVDGKIKWAAPAGGGGKVLQVVSTTKSDSFTSTSTSFADVTGLSVSITPSSASSKVLVLYNVSGSQAVAAQIARSRLMRDSTEINIGDAASTRARGTSDPFSVAAQIIGTTIAGSYLDSPATTSATTYKFQVATSGGTVYVNRSEDDSDSTIRSRTVSTITVMEIGA